MPFPSLRTGAPRRVALSLSLVALVAGAARAQEAAAPDAVPGEVLVGFTQAAPPAARGGQQRAALSRRAAAVASRVRSAVAGADVVGESPALGALRVRVRRAGLVETLAKLRRVEGVAYAEPNYYLRAFATPNDPYYGYQWGPRKMAADLAWEKYVPKATTVVAVVDSGVDYNHPDLSAKILRGGTGAVVGYDFVNRDADPSDDNGHGTHCAGTVAAQINNGVGVAGVAGWNGLAGSDTASTKVMPIKVLAAGGSGSTSGVAEGIVWAADNGAKVISLSLGGPASTTLQNAVSYAWNKGCVVVAAAGNSSTSAVSYPAGYANVISVAATDQNDTLASFSNYGTWVSVAAPGVSIASTTRGGGYGYMSGTSMATPHVAGEAALLLSQNPALTNAQVRGLIVSNTDPVNPYSGRTIAGGRVNVLRALNLATPAPVAPAPTGTGLRASYFANTILSGSPALTRTDATLNFNWGTGSPGAGIGVDRFSARWEGSVEAPVSGTYTFTTNSDDGVRVWVNGQQIINNWSDHAPTLNSGTVTLSAGQKASIRVEYYENGGGAVAQLLWEYPGQARQVVPQVRLYAAP